MVKTLCCILGLKFDEKKLKQLVPKLIPDANKFKKNLIDKMSAIGEDPKVLKSNTIKKLNEYVNDPIMLKETKEGADK